MLVKGKERNLSNNVLLIYIFVRLKAYILLYF